MNTGRRAFIRRMVGVVMFNGLLSYGLMREETITFNVRFLSHVDVVGDLHGQGIMEQIEQLQRDMAEFPNPPVGDVIRAIVTSNLEPR